MFLVWICVDVNGCHWMFMDLIIGCLWILLLDVYGCYYWMFMADVSIVDGLYQLYNMLTGENCKNYIIPWRTDLRNHPNKAMSNRNSMFQPP